MEQKRKSSRLRRYNLVAMKLNRDEWQAYVALHRATGASAAESIRAHIRADLAQHEARKGEAAMTDDLESFIAASGLGEVDDAQ